MPLDNYVGGALNSQASEGERFCSSSLPVFKHRGLSIAQLAKGGMICLDTMADQSAGENRPQSLKDDRGLLCPCFFHFKPQTPKIINSLLHTNCLIQGLVCIFCVQTWLFLCQQDRRQPGWLWNIWLRRREAASLTNTAWLMFGFIPATLTHRTITDAHLPYHITISFIDNINIKDCSHDVFTIN